VGGIFTDYVRSTHYLRIIEREETVGKRAHKGDWFKTGLENLRASIHRDRRARRGLMLAV